jgi:hypothetical protein
MVPTTIEGLLAEVGSDQQDIDRAGVERLILRGDVWVYCDCVVDEVER